jgi:hypothetical protein
MIHLLNDNPYGGANYPPPLMLGYWTLSDIYEEGGITDGSYRAFCNNGNYGLMLRGTASYANSQAIPKPGFQAYRLLHKLGDFEVSSSGGTTNDGVNLVATVDSANDSIQVLVYCHYASTTQSSAPTDNINLTINNIPWAPGQVQIKNFLVDTTHSNTYTQWVSQGRPTAPTNAQWDALKTAGNLYNTVTTQTLAAVSSPVTLSFTQNYFSVNLFVLSNPNQTSVKHPADAAARMMPAVISADIRDGKLVLNVAETGRYSVRLFSTDGRKVFESRRSCAGTAVFAVPHSLQGTFVLQCRGPKRSLVKHVVLRP